MTTTEIFLAILGVICGASGLFSFVQFLITRRDKKKDKSFERLNKRLDEHELSDLRMQLLMLMKLFPDNANEIMLVAKRYFSDLHGDWYMSSLFNTWLSSQGILPPIWFENHEISADFAKNQ